MKFTTSFIVLIVTIASAIDAIDLNSSKTKFFVTDDIIDFHGNANNEMLSCCEISVSNCQKSLSAPLEELDYFRNNLKSQFDEFSLCKQLPDSNLCITNLREKFSIGLNILVAKLVEAGNHEAFKLITTLNNNIKDCVVKYDQENDFNTVK